MLFVYSLIKKNITPEIVPLAQKSEQTRSYGMAYARGGRGGGCYTWTSTSVKEEVDLSAKGPIRGGAYRRINVSFLLE